jgi:hypothetical protein
MSHVGADACSCSPAASQPLTEMRKTVETREETVEWETKRRDPCRLRMIQQITVAGWELAEFAIVCGKSNFLECSPVLPASYCIFKFHFIRDSTACRQSSPILLAFPYPMRSPLDPIRI